MLSLIIATVFQTADADTAPQGVRLVEEHRDPREPGYRAAQGSQSPAGDYTALETRP